MCALVLPLEPLSRNRTSQLTGNCTHGRAAGCIREQEQGGGVSSEVRGSGYEAVEWAGLASGLEPSRIWSPGEPYYCAPCEWRRKWVSLP